MKETLDERLARIGAEAEAGEADQSDRPIPPHVKVTRPGRVRSKVLQVRLTPDEFAAIEEIANRRDLPPSTVAREQLLGLIAAGKSGPVTLAGLASQLEAVTLRAAEQLRALEAKALAGGDDVGSDSTVG